MTQLNVDFPEGFDNVRLTRDLNLTDIGILLRYIIMQNKEMLEIMRDAHTLDGTTLTNQFTIPKGWGPVKISFIDSQFHKNKPNNTSFEVPECPVQQLRLNNLGPGELYYSTNKFLNQLEAASRLLPGETREIKTPKRSIKQINLSPSGDLCQVRLEVLM